MKDFKGGLTLKLFMRAFLLEPFISMAVKTAQKSRSFNDVCTVQNTKWLMGSNSRALLSYLITGLSSPKNLPGFLWKQTFY